jgi:hypothetical protein
VVGGVRSTTMVFTGDALDDRLPAPSTANTV